mmetsp:Transcript_87784/g.248725  ORF Transcript_87784/g.248725 Transcript_87784/m.248725 type:complete len:333 (+) Transcript_87784:40-1038(+)
MYRRLARRAIALSVRASPVSSWQCLETPNPNVRKFEWPAAPHAGPAALGLLTAPGHVQDRLRHLEGVSDVFVAGGDPAGAPWVAVTRAGEEDWELLAPRVQAVLDSLGEPSDPGALPGQPSSAPSADSPEEAPSGTAAADGTAGEILEVLDHRIRPSVQADGGDVELVRWEAASGEVVLRLRGACRGCPQSAVTLQESILRTLQHFVQEVRSVRAEEEELASTSEDPTADIPWIHSGHPEPAEVMALAAAGTPFFSTFAGAKMEGARLRRVRFMSRLELAGRTPEHIFVSCPDCKARRTIEDPQDLLRADKGNTAGNAAVVICPTCCVLITP